MAILLQILGGFGVLWAIVGAPNVSRDYRGLEAYTTLGIPILIASAGILLRRLDRLEKMLEQTNPRKSS